MWSKMSREKEKIIEKQNRDYKIRTSHICSNIANKFAQSNSMEKRQPLELTVVEPLRVCIEKRTQPYLTPHNQTDSNGLQSTISVFFYCLIDALY